MLPTTHDSFKGERFLKDEIISYLKTLSRVLPLFNELHHLNWLCQSEKCKITL
jgi:hypothetical protein